MWLTVNVSGRCCYDTAFRHLTALLMNSKPSSILHPPVNAQDRFSHSAEELRDIAQDMLDYAKQRGATAAAAEVSVGFGQAVTVRQGEVETIEYNRDKGLGITVYIGQQRGNASTSDFSPQAVRDTVDAALSIARYTAKDDCSGLPDADMLARDYPDLDLYHPWDLPVDEAIELARQCEQAALDTDKRIGNSEGATVNLHEAQFVYANSLGFIGGYPSSRHSISCAVIAGQDDAMERDYWYAVARDASRSDGCAAGRAHRRRAHRAPSERAPDRHHAGAGAVRGADRIQPARAFRRRGQRRQPVPQILVPARPAWTSRFLRRTSTSKISRTSAKAWPPARSTTKVCGCSAAPLSRTACCAAISSAAIRRASWACAPPATRAATTT